ncbi:MAG: exosortase/archaeosortase family protein [Candidatus Eisenbacteria bacterium]|uniref:Exosortase/archaeosortase family protein n=1 Tax=Eiseniibacteriota bacterium TaxID=2212470 RepID=A0A538U9T7_UNCEI|nr:MAG: exosortase/archaeosortase family protein [Candidatus Eisenbacteria bacterium]
MSTLESRRAFAAPPGAGTASRLAPRAVLGGAVVAALLAAVYFRTAATLWHTWTHNDDYSHGPLVPLVSLAALWLGRHRLAALPLGPDARGLALLALACLLQVLGIRADVFALQGWSLLVMLTGLSLTFQGTARTRALAFPIGYLAFMLTFPPFVMNTLSYGLKEITMRLSTAASEALGAQFQRSGMTLYLAGGDLRMENPCSGLRSLLAMLATAAAFAWFQPGAGWRRLLLFLSGIPIAVAGNALRITALILVAHYAGVKQATGRFHDWSGYFVYAAALGALFAARALLTPRTARAGTEAA